MRCPTLTDLPPPPEGKTGWPWTEETPRVPENPPDGKPWPRISIVTPSYNQGQFIEETIRSVLLQGYPDIEYIIIDGGSTDESVDVIRKYERWITFWTSEPDCGQTNAINKGFKRSTGEIVAWLNSDDLYTISAFCTAAKAFVKQPHSAVVYGEIDDINADRSVLLHKKSHAFDLKKLYRCNYIPQPASFISNKVLKEIGFLDESFHYTMDYNLWVHLGQEEAIMQYIPVTLAWFRMHDCSKTVSRKEAFRPEEFKLFDMSLKRDASNASLTEIAYTRMFQLLTFIHSSRQSHEPLRRASGSTIKNEEERVFYLQSLQKVLRLIYMDDLRLEVNYPLPEALTEVYQAFDNEYNGDKNHSADIQSKWVDEQLIFLPNYLLSLEEKTKAIVLYKKIIRIRPSLLKYPQAYRFLARYFARTNLVSRIRGVRYGG